MRRSLGGDHLDELLLLAELLEQQAVHRGAVLALLLDEEIAGVGELPQQVLHLQLQPLQLDVALVEALVEGGELALAHLPNLGRAARSAPRAT